ncbi:MAG TPA: SigB/SigF/SigG family RNA polymerase sigma factor [Streptosporangiaceae bacterium]|jgi:RNA polymerase sigma-B factor
MTTISRIGQRQAESLGTLDDLQLLTEMQALPRESQRRQEVCGILVGRYRKLVRSCVRRYMDSPEPTEDLMQVGYVGLLKAINNFNPAVGTSLSAYAQPCITGEIKRHFRDKRWQVHVRRAAQELLLEMRTGAEVLTQRLGREPSDAELAEHLGASESELLEARRADVVFHVYSLDAPLSEREDSSELADVLGVEDRDVQHTVDMEAVTTHWGELPAREQRILLLRFYGNLTQAEIGDRLGISQMHVSRLLARSLGHLRDRLAGGGEQHSVNGAPATG